jgi:D-alanine-D-alanine ligase
MKRVAVFAGGHSGESVISERSAGMVMNNIDRSRFDPVLYRIYEDEWTAEVNNVRVPVNKHDLSIDRGTQKWQPEVVFMMIHGTPGEDGILQGYLDTIGLPYTTGGVLNMALTFNKGLTTLSLRNLGVPVADSRIVRKDQGTESMGFIAQIGFPCFVKPNRGGSSLGASRVNSEEELPEALKKAFAVDSEVLVESFMQGTEVTCGVIPWKGGIRALPATEIISENAFFDFEAKYQGKSHEITPARISDAIMQKVQDTSAFIYTSMNCRGMIRIDYMIVGDTPHVIEINTVPGFSEASIIPQQAAVEGIDKTSLISSVLDHV